MQLGRINRPMIRCALKTPVLFDSSGFNLSQQPDKNEIILDLETYLTNNAAVTLDNAGIPHSVYCKAGNIWCVVYTLRKQSYGQKDIDFHKKNNFPEEHIKKLILHLVDGRGYAALVKIINIQSGVC